MRIVAITGGIGSGKTTVAGWIRETGVPVLDADQISRELTAPGGDALPRIREAFGDGVFHADGTLSREALAAVVFTDTGRRETLNGILHPMVIGRMKRELEALEKRGEPIAVIEVPLLYESGMETMADKVLCVTASEGTRIRRLVKRSGLSPEQASARMRAQQDSPKTEALADYVLPTDGDTKTNRQRALLLWRQIISESGE